MMRQERPHGDQSCLIRMITAGEIALVVEQVSPVIDDVAQAIISCLVQILEISRWTGILGDGLSGGQAQEKARIQNQSCPTRPASHRRLRALSFWCRAVILAMMRSQGKD